MFAKYSTVASNINTTENVELFAQGWDWPVAGCHTLSEYVHKVTLDTSRTFFWLYEDETPVAFFGFSLHPDFNSFQTGTFIPPQYRGRSINSIIKLTSIVAFQAMNVPLISTVLEDNERSLKAMRKISGKDGTPFEEQYRNTKSYLFELHDVQIAAEQINHSLYSDIVSHENRFSFLLAGIPDPNLAIAS